MRSFILVSCCILGCGSSGDPPRDGGSHVDGETGLAFCAREHVGTNTDGQMLPFCDELYAERPWVHLPASTLTGSVDFHAAFIVRTSQFILSDGTEITVPAGEASLPTIATNRSVFTVWHVQGGSIEDASGERMLRGASVSAALVLTADALESRIRGVWEGTITPRDPAGSGPTQWAGTPVGIRIDVDTIGDPVLVYRDGIDGSGPELTEGATHQIVGRFDNYDANVTSSTGECFASFASMGDRNPLLGLSPDGISLAPNDVRLYRYLSMHAAFEDHAFMDPGYLMDWPDALSGLVEMGALHPTNFVQDADRPEWSELHAVTVHGTPSGFQIQYLRRVTGGGGSC